MRDEAREVSRGIDHVGPCKQSYKGTLVSF